MMDLSKFKKLFVSGMELKQLFIAVLKNWARYSTESDGVTLYNGLGYKSGYRVRSGGAEGANSASSCTGYIPVNPGDVIRVSGCEWGNTYGSAFNVYTSSFGHLGQACGDGSDYGQFGSIWIEYSGDSVIQKEDYYEWVVPPTATGVYYVSFIRVTGAVADGSKLVVYVNDDKVDTEIWKSGYKNWVPYSTESDGVTIYNGGLGYKDGYRIRSGGAESESDGVTITGFIPYKKGEILRLYPPFVGLNTGNTINFYDSSFTNLGQVTHSGARYGICSNSNEWAKENIFTEENGVNVLNISNVTNSDDIAYVRITNILTSNGGTAGIIETGAGMIVTVNEEIT